MIKLTKVWLRMWLYVICIIGGGLLFLIAYNFHELSFAQISVGMFVVVLVIHVLEEWKLPGGFYYMYNLLFSPEKDLLDRYPMSQLTDMITNLSGVITGTLMFFLWANNISVILFLTISIVELIVHMIVGFMVKRKFSDKGKKTIYNPGWGTVLIGFVPLAVYMIIGLINAQPTLTEILLGILLGFIVMLVEVLAPNKLLTNRNTPFIYDWGKGYFEKF